jgi:curved DNA-binding protein
MEFKDYYKILGVDRTADQKAISQAFRRLARQYHPDVNPGNKDAEQRFKEINEAYQVLSDPDKRAKYDQLLEYRQRGGAWEDLLRRRTASPGDGTFTVYTTGDLGQFSDFFRQLFGDLPGSLWEDIGSPRRGAGSRRRRIRLEDLFEGPPSRPDRLSTEPGPDTEVSVEISLEEAYQGTRRAVTVPSSPPRTLEVTIPRGIQSGQRIRLGGQGPGGSDLYLRVEVTPHARFTRQGDDILIDLPVPVWIAALGGQVEVPTLGGPVMMKIPPGTRDGQTFRLRGRGMPHLRGLGSGDQLVKIHLMLPDPLTLRDRELFEEMRRLHEGKAARV